MINNFTNASLLFNGNETINTFVNGTGSFVTPISVHFWNEDLFLILLLIIAGCEVFRLIYFVYSIVMQMYGGK